MKTPLKTLAVLALAGASAASLADYTVQINGNYNTSSTVGNVNTAASGDHADSSVNVAGVQGRALVQGNFNATAQAGNINSSAQGNSAAARVNLGGVQTN